MDIIVGIILIVHQNKNEQNMDKMMITQDYILIHGINNKDT